VTAALSVRGLGKRYRLGERQPYKTLRDSLAGLFGRRPGNKGTEVFWALRNVGFELAQGEVLGIIGRNGAGKSTLLKVLGRITAPDEGMVEINGRVGALLEVGTGFHPELTGRENVFLNGVLLGMRRADVKRKFDEIVAFAGVEEFLDTPVKRYSSGMRVRLGFSVAAFLEPDVLLIDEVLAVGDAEFQRRCLGRMQDVATEGRTILFVSHQMEAIQSLCSRAIWLNGGAIQKDGAAEDVVKAYLAHTLGEAGTASLAERVDRSGEGGFRISSVAVNPEDQGVVSTGSKVRFNVTVSRHADDRTAPKLLVRLALRDHMDRLVALLSNELTGEDLAAGSRTTTFTCHVDRMSLVPGTYLLDMSLWLNDVLQDKIFRAASFDVSAGDFHGAGRPLHVGILHIDQRWTVS
jgi:lipopolysaccharide transport system ATP-binding protein